MTTSHLQPATSHAPRSTGPRTAAGKRISSRNALTHGLTSRSPILPTEDPAAYQRHCHDFHNEYQPATPTETHLTQELADTAWRLNRIPSLEAALFSLTPNPQTQIPALATLSLHSQRLSRQFQKTLDHLREIQTDRRRDEARQLERAAALLEFHKRKGLPYDPAQFGFVFSKDQIEAHAQRLMRLNQSRHLEYVHFHMQPPVPYSGALDGGTIPFNRK
jgi:hypothetical protein